MANLISYDATDEELDNIRRAVERRKKLQKQVYGRPPQSSHEDGAMGRAAHLSGMSPEGIAGEILWTMIVNLLEALFQTQYMIQNIEYNWAKGLGIHYDPEDPTIKIFVVGEDGELDFTQTYAPGDEIPRAAIRANGYVPPPSWEESFQIQWDLYESQMWGMSSLSPARKERAFKSYEAETRDNMRNRDDAWLAQQRAMAAARRPRPK